MKKKHFIALVTGVVAAMLFAIPAVGAPSDVNNDNLPDRWEKTNDLSLKVKQHRRDQDRDGLKNMGEYEAGTDPRDADSNNDGDDDATDAQHGDCPKGGGEGGEGNGPHPPKPPAPPAQDGTTPPAS